MAVTGPMPHRVAGNGGRRVVTEGRAARVFDVCCYPAEKHRTVSAFACVCEMGAMLIIGKM